MRPDMGEFYTALAKVAGFTVWRVVPRWPRNVLHVIGSKTGSAVPWSAVEPRLLVGQALLDGLADLSHIGAAGQFRFEHAHHLAHILYALGPRGADSLIHEGVDVGFAEWLGQVVLDDADFEYFLIGQFGAAGLLELADGVLALLDHLFQHAEDLVIIKGDALVDFALLDRGSDQA